MKANLMQQSQKSYSRQQPLMKLKTDACRNLNMESKILSNVDLGNSKDNVDQNLNSLTAHLVSIHHTLVLIGIHCMQGSTATTRHGVARKRNTERLRHAGNLFRKNLQLKDVCKF